MSIYILSSGVLDPIGSEARRPVIVAFLIFIGISLLWLFALATAEEDNPERLYVADRALSPSSTDSPWPASRSRSSPC